MKEIQAKDLRAVIRELRRISKGIRFSRLAQTCNGFFAPPRRRGTSHLVYQMPWSGDPRVNSQEGSSGLAKPYQTRQVRKALEKLEKHLIEH